MEQHSEDLRSAIASYLPDRQIITFSQEMMVLPKGEGRGHFQGPTVLGYFFHEWIHYLHNVSTIHGMSAFSSLIGLWNAFRFTTDKSGFGQGAFNDSSAGLLKTQAYVAVLMTTRRPADMPLSCDALVEQCRVIACKPAGNVNGAPDRLDVTVEESKEEGDNVLYLKTVGSTEILESVAYLLESRLLVHAFGQERSIAPVFPYQSLTLLAKHLAPNLSEKEVLLCGLASLQSTFPADAILQLLKTCSQLAKSGQQVDAWLEQSTIRNLQDHAANVRAGLDEMYAMFPVDDGVSRAVRSTVSYMRKNLDARIAKPFFELDLIEDIRIAGPNGFHRLMDELMDKHGICSCLQERPGSETDIGRDALFNFEVASKDEKLNESRLVLLASFDYLIGHVRKNGTFLRTEAVERRCPFYTSCLESTRWDHPDDCDKRAWRAVITRPDKLCTYAAGVKDLGVSKDVRARTTPG